MDIKTKIDELTEAEAKEILEKLLGSLSMLSYITSNTEMTPNEIENHFFDEALELIEWRRRMTEQDEMRALAEAHGCGYEYIPVSEKAGIYKRVYEPVRPLPCVRDEHGEIKRQTVKQLFAKIDEELNEFKAAVLREATVRNDLRDLANGVDDDTDTDIADEAADTITAITTLCHALGIDADMRDEAQRRVNRKNLERGRL